MSVNLKVLKKTLAFHCLEASKAASKDGFNQQHVALERNIDLRVIAQRIDNETLVGYLLNGNEVSEEKAIEVLVKIKERKKQLTQFRYELKDSMREYAEKAKAQPRHEFVLSDLLGDKLSVEVHGPHEIWRLNSVKRPQKVIVNLLLDKFDELLPHVTL